MRTLQTVIYFLTQFMSIKLDILGYSISLFNIAAFNIFGGIIFYFLWKISR